MRLKTLKSKTEIFSNFKKLILEKACKTKLKSVKNASINSRLCRPKNVEENKITTDLDGENSVMSFFLSVFLLNIKTLEQNY